MSKLKIITWASKLFSLAIFSSLISALANILLVGYLTNEDYGEFSYFLAWATIAGSFIDLGLTQSFPILVASTGVNTLTLASNFLLIKLVGFTAFSIILAFRSVGEMHRELLFVLILCLPYLGISFLYEVKNLHLKYQFFVMIERLFFLLSVLLLSCLKGAHSSSLALALGCIGASYSIFLLLQYFDSEVFFGLLFNYSRFLEAINLLWKSSAIMIPYMAIGLFQLINTSFIRILYQNKFGFGHLAYLSLGMQVLGYSSLIQSQVDSIYRPKFASISCQSPYPKHFFFKLDSLIVNYILFVLPFSLFLSVVIVNLYPIALRLFGVANYDAFGSLKIGLICVFFSVPLMRLSDMIFMSLRRHRLNVCFSVLFPACALFVVNILLSRPNPGLVFVLIFIAQSLQFLATIAIYFYLRSLAFRSDNSSFSFI
jgi:O-antigen/teichoic acid export membrane protein